MAWAIIRIIGFLGAVVFVAGMVALASCWRYEPIEIDGAYQREVVACRWISIGMPTDARLPIEHRAAIVTTALVAACHAVRMPLANGIMGKVVQEGATHIDHADWLHTVYFPRLQRFLPVLYMRIETYGVVYMTCFGFIILAWLFGQYHARRMIREGVHKRYIVPKVLTTFLRAFLWLGVAAVGWVAFPPVPYWIIPSVLLSGAIFAVWRAHMIEIK